MDGNWHYTFDVHKSIGDWKCPFRTYPNQEDLPSWPAPATSSSRWATTPPCPSNWAPWIQSSKTPFLIIPLLKAQESMQNLRSVLQTYQQSQRAQNFVPDNHVFLLKSYRDPLKSTWTQIAITNNHTNLMFHMHMGNFQLFSPAPASPGRRTQASPASTTWAPGPWARHPWWSLIRSAKCFHRLYWTIIHQYYLTVDHHLRW